MDNNLELTNLIEDEEKARKGQEFADKLIKISQYVLLVFVIALAIFCINAYSKGYFDSIDAMREYIASFGGWGFIILTIFQTMQVIIPFLLCQPGYAVGGMLFGTVPGFLCNYIGISLGTILAYYLASKYGVAFVKRLISEEKYNKYYEWANSKPNYFLFMTLAFLLPLFPDDFLAFLSGLLKVDFKKYVIITILTKPWCIFAYCCLFEKFGEAVFTTGIF